MKKPINQKDVENDINKLEKDIKLFQKEMEIKYKDYLDDQE